MKFDDEKVLVKELKKFNEKAFNYFVTKYQKMIIGYLNHFFKDKSEAWNVSQEVFIAVFKNIHQFREDSSLKTWLFRIAHNQAINRLRYLKRRKSDKHNSIDEMKEKYSNYDISWIDDPLDKIQTKERDNFLKLALNYLDEKDKEVITLRFFSELNYEEIAEILNISVGTVKSRLFRGKQRLKTTYLEVFKDEL